MKPSPWWEEYLGLRIRFDLLKPARVWKTVLYYVAWIVPTALLSLIASWSASWFGVQLPTPVQARAKEVHVTSQNEQGLAMQEESNEMESMFLSAPPFQVNVFDDVRVRPKETVYGLTSDFSSVPMPLLLPGTTSTEYQSPSESPEPKA
jgi:hypothetical protein